MQQTTGQHQALCSFSDFQKSRVYCWVWHIPSLHVGLSVKMVLCEFLCTFWFVAGVLVVACRRDIVWWNKVFCRAWQRGILVEILLGPRMRQVRGVRRKLCEIACFVYLIAGNLFLLALAFPPWLLMSLGNLYSGISILCAFGAIARALGALVLPDDILRIWGEYLK